MPLVTYGGAIPVEPSRYDDEEVEGVAEVEEAYEEDNGEIQTTSAENKARRAKSAGADASADARTVRRSVAVVSQSLSSSVSGGGAGMSF